MLNIRKVAKPEVEVMFTNQLIQAIRLQSVKLAN